MQNDLPIEKRRPWQSVLSLLLGGVLLLGGMAAGLFAIIAGASDTVISLDGAGTPATEYQRYLASFSHHGRVEDDRGVVWGEDAEIELFKVFYENGERQVTVAGRNNHKVIAPGTENYYTFAVKNVSGGVMDYKLCVEAFVTGLEGTDVTLPMQARLNGNEWLVGSEEELRPILELNGAEESAVLPSGEEAEYQLQWCWPFEQDHDGDGSAADGDALDTWLATRDEPVSLTIRLTVLYNYHFEEIPVVTAPIPKILNGEDHMAYLFGYPDGTVRPEADITRAEYAAILYRLLRDEVRAQFETDDCAYSDVPLDAWYRTEVATLTNLGIFVGYPDGTFRGDQTISRAEVAVILAKLHDQKVSSGKTGFSDIRSHWAEGDIKTIEKLNWVSGYPDGTFRPDDPISRAETVSVMNRVLHRLPETRDHLLPDEMITWPDNADTKAWYYIAIQEATNGHDHINLLGNAEQWIKVTNTPN